MDNKDHKDLNDILRQMARSSELQALAVIFDKLDVHVCDESGCMEFATTKHSHDDYVDDYCDEHVEKAKARASADKGDVIADSPHAKIVRRFNKLLRGE